MHQPILISWVIGSCMEDRIIARASSSTQKLKMISLNMPHLHHCIILSIWKVSRRLSMCLAITYGRSQPLIPPSTRRCQCKQWFILVPTSGMSRVFVAMAFMASVTSIVRSVLGRFCRRTRHIYVSSTVISAMGVHLRLYGTARVSIRRCVSHHLRV